MISHSVETPRGTGAFFFNTLRLRRPMRAGIFSVLLFSSQPLCLFNPLALRALPLYFAAQNTEEEGILDSVAVAVFNPSVFLNPTPNGQYPKNTIRKQRGRRLKSSIFTEVFL